MAVSCETMPVAVQSLSELRELDGTMQIQRRRPGFQWPGGCRRDEYPRAAWFPFPDLPVASIESNDASTSR